MWRDQTLRLMSNYVREADISRLSFAVELAEEFYGRVKGEDVAFNPAKLLWLIQRDFLQGKSVQEMVNEALRRVPNHNDDRDLEQVNQIRDSLAIMGDNSTAFSLPQPHLQRTKLCEMKDTDLDPGYVRKREKLKEVVASLVSPKIVEGKMLNGKQFVSFLEKNTVVDERASFTVARPHPGPLANLFRTIEKASSPNCLYR